MYMYIHTCIHTCRYILYCVYIPVLDGQDRMAGTVVEEPSA